MTTYMGAVSGIAIMAVLAACAANTANLKSPAEESAAGAENSVCQTQTGSRIAINNVGSSEFVSCYSSDDLKRTGVITVGNALTLLDPTVTVHH
jgi:hypothetical protein